MVGGEGGLEPASELKREKGGRLVEQPSTMQGKSLDSPDETREFENGKMDVVNLGEVTVGRAVFEPGWRWSENVKPIAGTDSCQVPHVGYVISGRMHVRMDDGSEQEVGPGDAVTIPPGHDAWIIGDEACTMLDFSGAERYAKGASQGG
jgi:quercetin dioxygenase-like cupin family protein